MKMLCVDDLVDATILKCLERFEHRPAGFSVGNWLTRLAFETIHTVARDARRALLGFSADTADHTLERWCKEASRIRIGSRSLG
jgi:DNA-directed RNA polymerase specialized sigma24 family protein